MKQLIDNLIEKGYLVTPNIIDAFSFIDRVDFVPENIRNEAYNNIPLPIGYGQTISQPLTVAFMLELLKSHKGEKILDVGSGSAWQSSLLARIVGGSGKIFAIEVIPELSEIGKKNSQRYKLNNIKFIVGDGSKGYSKEAPYDKIIVAAAAFKKIPEELYRQLKIGGRLVIPVDNSIWLVIKKSEDKFEEKEFPGFAFVPLIEK
ncbi:protein-L-isoaspartate O-methyltransferase [Candidatus Parcubacteria bacterium]|nr:protein-L-isoaspartate O-methyltransferase [Candidatus Parcubacteria bacterium]